MKNFIRYFRRFFVFWFLIMACATVFIAILGQRVPPAITVAIMIISFIVIPVAYTLGTLVINPLLKRQWRSAGVGVLACVGFVIGGLVLIDIVPKIISNLGSIVIPAVLILLFLKGMSSVQIIRPRPDNPRNNQDIIEEKQKRGFPFW